LSLHSLITKKNELFGQVQDYFFITEFQHRGTEHDHGLLWIQNVSIYQKSLNVDVIGFIDQYLTCDSTILSKHMIQFQTHHNTKTCKKHKNSSCRFSFPIPLIDETCILHPLCNENNDMQTMQKKLSFILWDKSYSKNITFSMFLVNLGIKKQEYVMLL